MFRIRFFAVCFAAALAIAMPARAQTAIARQMLLEAAARPAPPTAAVAAPAPAPQSGSTGTAHGINLVWTASSTSGVTYSVYRQVGSFTAATWPSPIGTPIATGLTALAYLDPASGLAASTTYSYGVAAVSGSDQSGLDVTTVAVPSTGFPNNPNAPTGVTATVQ